MGLIGWIHHARDLSDEHRTIITMTTALGICEMPADSVRLARHAAFGHCHPRTGYADWRHPEHPDPDLSVVVDGQLSNRTHLEHQLFERPRPLASDADLLLHAYRAWGAGLADRIDGSYAIAIWDNRARQLVLMRDAIGAKTLFYAQRGDGVVFASTVTALLAHPEVEPIVDADGLNELLALGPVRTPGHGVIRDVAEVLPGELVRTTPAGVRRRRYFSFEADVHHHSLTETVATIHDLLAARTEHLRAHPADAVLLSGGVASAAAGAMTAGPGDQQRSVWTLISGGSTPLKPNKVPHLRAASLAASHLRLRHHLLIAGWLGLPRAPAAARAALDLPGEPAIDAPLVALLDRIAATGAESIVTGDGAATVFGSYRWLRQPSSPATADFPWRPYGLAATDLLNAETRARLRPDRYRLRRYDQATATVPHLSGAGMLGRQQRIKTHLALTHYLPRLLVRLDQLAGAAGLAVQTPMADWLLASYLYNIPNYLRHPRGVANGLLLRAVADLVPAPITWLKPLPFPAMPNMAAWHRTQHLRLLELIRDKDTPLASLLDAQRVADALTMPAVARGPYRHSPITHVLEVAEWLERHHITLT
ncbi:asparagine synthase-related protein [Actinoplanes sp. NPDC000266]